MNLSKVTDVTDINHGQHDERNCVAETSETALLGHADSATFTVDAY